MYNCVVVDDESMGRDTLVEYIGKVPFLNLVGVFESPIGVAGLTDRIDIVFSDIAMPEMDGITFLKSLQDPPAFIFASGHPDHAAEGFELDVVDYLVKPFGFPRFEKAANKAKALLDLKRESKKSDKYLVVKDRNRYVIVEYVEVLYIKTEKDYLQIKTLEGEYTLWRTLKSVLEQLPVSSFAQIHKSYVVNLKYVHGITAKQLTLKGKQGELPVGEDYQKGLRRHFGIA